jgi:tetratricopeptide (TPR) repeat protein
MTYAARKIEQARQLHNKGRWAEAERLYVQALEASPGQTDGLHMLGILHAQTGREETAVQLLGAAIGIEGPKAHLCRNLGILLERQGRADSAIACYRQSLASDGQATEVWVRMAGLLTELGRFGEAAQSWRRALETDQRAVDSQIDWRFAWAKTLALSGDRTAAAEQLARILRTVPDHVGALFDWGVIQMQLDRVSEAVATFSQVVTLAPAHAEALNNLGVLRHALAEHEAALEHYESCLVHQPEYSEARYNLGSLLQEMSEPEAAAAEFRRVLEKTPEHAAAWTNLGNCLLGQGFPERALQCYERTLALTPGEQAAIWNAGLAHLTAGRYTEGWKGYECRFDVPGATPRRKTLVPRWQGESLAGKRIWVWAEQGLGDSLQFCRYLPILSDQGATVVFEVPAVLHGLLGSLRSPIEVVAPHSNRPIVADFQIPLMSLPALAATTIETIPTPEGYLRASPELRECWRQRLQSVQEQFRVGFVWQGNPRYKNDRTRSLPADGLAPLRSVPGVALINLQFGKAVPAEVATLDLSAEIGNFASTAALVAELDLVVTVDTSMAHLAGALGKECWVMLGCSADWRWLQHRSDSPWYSHHRLFRQPVAKDWSSVVTDVAAALWDRVAE